MTKGTETGKIQVYVRVRPFTGKERDKRDVNAIEIHHEHSLIRVSDQRNRTNYFFDGVFGPDATNQEVYQKVGRPLVYAAMQGYHGTLLTYGQTGTGKTYTLLSEDGVTSQIVNQCFERIGNDEIHNYKIFCSFLQVYQEKVYDLLNTRSIMDLSVREHPKKGVYVANLTQHDVRNAADVFSLIEIGKKHLVIAETKMVRYSSRSHSIIQLIIQRRLKEHIVGEKVSTNKAADATHEAVQESIMTVDETINSLLKELKHERKTHHKGERECLKDLMEKELHDGNNFEGDLIIKGKLNLCDLAGSERLTKTKAEGVRLTEAKYLNTSLLELGNVIHALARGQKRHVPYRNSTLTRLLQDCLGDNGKTNFIICVAPTLGEVNETKCSLNFGLRAMRITNVARLHVEVNYRVLAERLAKKLEEQDLKHKFEKLEYLREIQRLKSAVTTYEENEHYDGTDHEKLVTVIANLSKSMQKEKEEKTNLRSELVCLKKQVTHSPTTSKPETEVQLLVELMSMELLCNLHQSEAMKKYVLKTSLPTRVKDFLKSVQTQEALILNVGCILQLLDLHLESSNDNEQWKELSDRLQFNISRAGSVELVSKDCSIKISPLGTPREPVLGIPSKSPTGDGGIQGPTGGIRKMFGRLLGREPKEIAAPKSPSQEQHAHTDDSSSDKAKTLMRKLAKSKEKVEEQVVNLLSEAFGEQMMPKEGKSPPWSEMRKKLSEFMMLKRNNIHDPVDGELSIQSEEVAAILERCLRYVVIDKALFACLLVVELMHLQGTSGINQGNPSPCAWSAGKQDERTITGDQVIQNGVHDHVSSENEGVQDVSCPGNLKNTNTSERNSERKSPQKQDKSVNEFHNELTSSQELRGLKETKLNLEHEIRDVHDDTTRLETELFSTMEDRARIEDDMIGIRDHVNKLRMELFHLKIEKTNLEADLRKTRITDGGRDLHTSPEHLELELARDTRGPLRETELSDVMEASHESMDSENSSQLSDGHETRDTFLKTCFSNMSQVYTLMPSPDNIVISEEDTSDGKEDPTLSDANIDSDSDEDIVITKLARSMQGARSPGNSPTKEKGRFGQGSPTKGGKKDISANKAPSKAGKNKDPVPQAAKDKVGRPTEGKTHEELIRDLQKRLHKAEQDIRQLREANEDLDEDLTHKKGQLAQAQKTIIDLEGQVVEEKDTCEQVRQLYIDVKERCDILESKATTLRTELERALRENTILTATSVQGQPNDKSPQRSWKKSLSKSSPKSSHATKGIDLRYPPENPNTLSEIKMINLLEENAEFKTKLERVSQEKTHLEQQKTQMNGKAEKLESVFRFTEDQCRKLKEEILVLKKGKLQLGNNLSDLQSRNSNELEKYRDKATQLVKDLEFNNQTNENLARNNSLLQSAVAKMEGELVQWRKDFEVVYYECERLEGELLKNKQQTDQMRNDQQSAKDESKCTAERTRWNDQKRQERKQQGKENEVQSVESPMMELRQLNTKLQSEIVGMLEHQQALEEQYSKAKSDSEQWKADLSRATSKLKELENKLHQQGDKPHGRGDGNSICNADGQNMLGHKDVGKVCTTQHNMFYTLTGEISESNESLEPDTTHGEEEMQLLKLENTYLLQQISEKEQTHKDDLEKAKGTTERLERELEVAKEQLSMKEKNFDDQEYLSLDENNLGNINAIKGRCELLQRKNSELLTENSELQTTLQVTCIKKDKLLAENDFMKAESASLREKMLHLQKEKREARKALKTATFSEILEHPEEKQSPTVQFEATLSTYSAQSSYRVDEKDNSEITQLQDDLLRVTSEKLKLEFELLNATAEIDRLRGDLEQNQSEKTLINTQLNDNIQQVANLEIRLLEMRCSNESMKGQFVHLREEKRQESYYRQEASIHKEVMEKRLEETLMSKQKLRHELDNSIENTQDALETIERLEKQKQDEETEAEQLRQQSEGLQEELQNTMTTIKEFEDRAQQLVEEKYDIEKQIKTLRRQNFELKQVLQSRENQNQKGKERVNNLEKRVKNMKSELERLQQRNISLKKDFEAKETDKKDKATQCKVKDVHSENTRLKGEVCRLQEEREQVEKCVRAVNKPSVCRMETEHMEAITMVRYTDISESGKLDTTFAEDTEKDSTGESKVEDKTETISEERNLSEMAANAMSAMAMMSKEKLLLESTASRFSRVQMRLELSLSKALAQNETLKIKIAENDAAMQVLRARVHELETKHENAVKWKEIKRQITISSDSDSDSDLSSPKYPTKPLDFQTEEMADASENKNDETISSPENGLEVILEADERVFVQQQLSTQPLSQKEAKDARMCETEVKDSISQEEKEPETTEEISLDLAGANITEVTEMVVDMQLLQHENGQTNTEPEKVDDEFFGEICTTLLIEETADSQQSDISFLKQEKASLLAELEAVKHQYNMNESEVEKKNVTCEGLEDKLKLLTSSYEQEKDSLVQAVENIKNENEDIKERLRELQEFQSTFDEVRKRQADAEKLVEELEKEMLHQTDIRKGLERQLLDCQGQLKEMENQRGQVLSIGRENEEMVLVNTRLKAEIGGVKTANENLLRTLDSQQHEIKSLQKRLHARSGPNQAPVGKVIETDTMDDKESKLVCMQSKQKDQDTQTDVKRKSAQCDQENSTGKELLANSTISTSKLNDLKEELVQCQENIFVNENIGKTAAGIPLSEQKLNEEFTGRSGDVTTEKNKADIGRMHDEQQRRNVDTTSCSSDRQNIEDNTIKVTEANLREESDTLVRENSEEEEMENTQQILDVEEKQENYEENVKDGERNYKSYTEGISENEMDGVKTTRCAKKRDRVSENELIESEEQPNWRENQATDADAQTSCATANHSETSELESKERNENVVMTVEKCQDEGVEVKSERKVEESVKQQQRILHENEEKLRTERLILEEQIDTLLKENESLISKIDNLQTQSVEAVPNELMRTDEENEELRLKLNECLEENVRMEEENRVLEMENARLEVELSDAIECRESIERELVHIREDRGKMRNELEDELQQLKESHSKIETALSFVLEENSRAEADLSLLQQENRMLKNYKIMEITDNCTQFSPRTTEDESEGEGRWRKSNTKGKSFQSQAVKSNALTKHVGSDLIHYTAPKENNLSELEPAIPDSRLRTSIEVHVDRTNMENSSSTNVKSSQESSASVITPQSQDFQVSDEESYTQANISHATYSIASEEERIELSSYGNVLSDDDTDSEQLARKDSCTPTMPHTYETSLQLGNPSNPTDGPRYQRHLTSYQGGPNSAQYRQIHERRESDEYESSLEVGNNSSLVSVTDLDISNSSDFISSDGTSMGTNNRGYKRLQLDLAETKCSNALLTNEVSILRRHNCELQNQLQKYVKRNNQLKQKVCDRTMSLRRTEKDGAATKEDNESLLAQAAEAKEKLFKAEKEKSKLERNVASTKGENKRLKADLSSLKAEMYRITKEVVNLQNENRKIHMDLNKAQEDSKSVISLHRNDSTVAHQVSASHNNLMAGPWRSLQETSSSLQGQRANSDLTYKKRNPSGAPTPEQELASVFLSDELKEGTGEEFVKHWGQAIYRVSSLGGQTQSDTSWCTEPEFQTGGSAQGAQLSYESTYSNTAGGNEHVAGRSTSEDHALNRRESQLSYDSTYSNTAGGNEHVAGRSTPEDHALNIRASQLSYDSIASSTAGGNEHVVGRSTSEDHALNREEGRDQETKRGNKKGIKMIFKKLHKRKKSKSSHNGQ